MKQAPAFTLIEVMIALFILATTWFVLSSVQMRSYLRVESNRKNVERVYLIKKELYQLLMAPPKSEKPVVLKLEEPSLRITSNMLEIPKKSSLHTFKDNLRIVQSEADWKDAGRVRKEKMISFVYKEFEDEKEKK